MALIYLDSSVLLAANRPAARGHASAVALLGSDASFASSDLVRPEVLPKAVYHRQVEECALYAAYFDAAQAWAVLDQALVSRALTVAGMYGLAGLDALHVAAAERLAVDEFVTVERPTSPLLRVSLLAVRSLSVPPG